MSFPHRKELIIAGGGSDTTEIHDLTTMAARQGELGNCDTNIDDPRIS